MHFFHHTAGTMSEIFVEPSNPIQFEAALIAAYLINCLSTQEPKKGLWNPKINVKNLQDLEQCGSELFSFESQASMQHLHCFWYTFSFQNLFVTNNW